MAQIGVAAHPARWTGGPSGPSSVPSRALPHALRHDRMWIITARARGSNEGSARELVCRHGRLAHSPRCFGLAEQTVIFCAWPHPCMQSLMSCVITAHLPRHWSDSHRRMLDPSFVLFAFGHGCRTCRRVCGQRLSGTCLCSRPAYEAAALSRQPSLGCREMGRAVGKAWVGGQARAPRPTESLLDDSLRMRLVVKAGRP